MTMKDITMNKRNPTLDDLTIAKSERATGFTGRTAEEVAADMAKIIKEAEHGQV